NITLLRRECLRSHTSTRLGSILTHDFYCSFGRDEFGDSDRITTLNPIRRASMKLLYLLAAVVALSGMAFAQNVPEIPFEGDVNFLKLPDNMYLGEPSGIAVNSKKHIFVFNRGNSSG